MPLLNHSSYCEFTEWEMQENVIKFMSNYKFYRTIVDESWESASKNVFSEIHNPTTNRRSDIIIWLNKKTLINIECKLFDVIGVIKQAKDHLCWTDYSYICMPHSTYIASCHIAEMIEIGIGLLLYDDENKKIYEVVYAKFNRKKNKIFKEQAVKKLQSILNDCKKGQQLQLVT